MRISDWSSDVCSSDLDGMDDVRAITPKQADRGKEHPEVADQLPERKTDGDIANAWRGGDAVMPHAGHRHVAPFMEAQQRDLMPLRRQSFGRHAHGNGRAAFLVKGLGRQHQYLHEAIDRKSTRLNSSH